MSPAGYHSNDEKWNNGYKESDTYIQQTIAFYYRLNKVSTSIDSAKLKKKYPDIASECSKTTAKAGYVKITLKDGGADGKG